MVPSKSSAALNDRCHMSYSRYDEVKVIIDLEPILDQNETPVTLLASTRPRFCRCVGRPARQGLHRLG